MNDRHECDRCPPGGICGDCQARWLNGRTMLQAFQEAFARSKRRDTEDGYYDYLVGLGYSYDDASRIVDIRFGA